MTAREKIKTMGVMFDLEKKTKEIWAKILRLDNRHTVNVKFMSTFSARLTIFRALSETWGAIIVPYELRGAMYNTFIEELWNFYYTSDDNFKEAITQTGANIVYIPVYKNIVNMDTNIGKVVEKYYKLFKEACECDGVKEIPPRFVVDIIDYGSDVLKSYTDIIYMADIAILEPGLETTLTTPIVVVKKELEDIVEEEQRYVAKNEGENMLQYFEKYGQGTNIQEDNYEL